MKAALQGAACTIMDLLACFFRLLVRPRAVQVRFGVVDRGFAFLHHPVHGIAGRFRVELMGLRPGPVSALIDLLLHSVYSGAEPFADTLVTHALTVPPGREWGRLAASTALYARVPDGLRENQDDARRLTVLPRPLPVR